MTRGFRKTYCQILVVSAVLLLINYHISQVGRTECDCTHRQQRNEVTTEVNYRTVPDNVSVSKSPRDLGMFTNLVRASSTNDGSLLYGKPRLSQGFLTLGIPSVKRPNDALYLLDTIQSIIDNTDDKDKARLTVVIYLADFNITWNTEMARRIYTNFSVYVNEGLLHIIIAPMSIYPEFKYPPPIGSVIKDSEMRTKWRSKQNVDYAFIILYSKNISEYYLQLEDDLVCAKNFVSDIETFVRKTKRFWICLEFSKLGFIGKLFRSIHLEKLAHTLLAYYDTQPCDILIGNVYTILGQKEPIHYSPSLFQHRGKWSSLKFKMMPAIDKTFKGFGTNPLQIVEIPRGDNPTAKLVTNMHWSPGYGPEHAYNHSSSLFWAQDPLTGSFLDIVYKRPMDIRRIVVSTGDVKARKDILQRGSVKVGETESCHRDGHTLGEFVMGEFDSDILGSNITNGIKCIAVCVSTGQQEWLIIRDIAVFIS